MADHLLDTNVISKIYYGDAALKKQYIDIVDSAINTVVYIECIQGSIKKKDKNLVKRTLDLLTNYPLTPQIAQKAIEIIDLYSASEGLFLPDALIAATAIEHDLTLVTFNTKDFKFIKGLIVIEP